jgi:hypothetical protein
MNKVFEISGPEARAKAEIIVKDDSTYLMLSNIWIAPGAPDVQVALSSNEEGKLDDTLQHIAFLPYEQPTFKFDISGLNLFKAKTVIIYCTKFQVHFGHGKIIV